MPRHSVEYHKFNQIHSLTNIESRESLWVDEPQKTGCAQFVNSLYKNGVQANAAGLLMFLRYEHAYFCLRRPME